MEWDTEGWKRGLMSDSPTFPQVREVTILGSNLLGSTTSDPSDLRKHSQGGLFVPIPRADVSARGC
ncbi:hypothetical protein GCM10010449_03990 [Streptomyces rectiviolaceus]|uniref:Uncharacterized protein n=1 Tax=Streptomyces rectiviolaceus TaxID=332591 RepID=A0ABP6MBK6_9ACTN